MSASLILRYGTMIGNPIGNLQLRCVNVVGSPVVGTPLNLGNGAAIADDYVCTFSGNTTVVITGNAKNPYIGTKSVVCDGLTPNTDLIPGFSIILSASCVTGWSFKLTCGAYMDGSGVITDVLGFGVITAGTSSSGIRVVCENVGDQIAQQCVVYSLPGSTISGANYDKLISSLLPHSNPSRHKMASPASKALTFVNWATDPGTGKKKADVKVNGATAIVGALFDGATVYEYGSGNGYNNGTDLLVGQQLTLANTVLDPTTSTITDEIFDGYAWLEFAPDVLGSPGTYANQDLTITQPGENSGVIKPSGGAYFWVRWNLPLATVPGAMRKMFVMTRGLTT